ncbi:MAG: response regulator [Anaerolineae bacterium]|nr:response regulator [Anaerolineae bacterium]
MGLTVLVVDDDKGLRSLCRMVLECEGYSVWEASNGAEALQFLMNRTPDVIVIDMLMPMLGGEAVMRRIHQLPFLAHTRVIVMTAYPRYREMLQGVEVDAFLVKPVMPAQLIEAVAGETETHEVAASGE